MRAVIHESRNHLAIAVANLEAFIDGKLEPSEARLRAVLQALNELDVLMSESLMSTLVAEMREHLAVGVATIEAFIESGFEATAARLGTVLSALNRVGILLNAVPANEADDLSEAMESRLETIDVCRLIDNETTAIEAAARKKGIAFSVARCAVRDSACSTFLCDPVRIGQIVKNVLLNAIRYTPPGGAVHVDCRRSGGELAFTVDDGGPGVPPGEVERIFESGFRGKATAAQPGSGLGLALVKQFVQDHDGTIEVSSLPDGGASFVVRLPGRSVDAEACAGCSPGDLSLVDSSPHLHSERIYEC